MINILKSKLSVTELNELLDNLLQQAMVMNKTKAGTLQIINAKEQSLELIVSFGLDTTFTEHFKKVMINDGSVCARALERGETIFIEDLRQDRSFTPHLPVALQNNITAVQSTPMISQNGNIVGIMSTHFKLPRKPSKIEIAKFQSFCRNAAVIIEEYILN